MLKNSKDKLRQLAERLLEKEVIFKDDLESILGKRPFKTNDEKIEEAKALKKNKWCKSWVYGSIFSVKSP